jgi:polysaccharide biosynthesis/export protein
MRAAGSPMKIVFFSASLLALALTACSNEPMLRDVLAQAAPDGKVAFDVVKVDDAVLTTLLDRPPPPFHERFKKYLPPADPKIAVGDTVSVVIWESAANGLFGNSLTELTLPAGATARLLGERPATLGGTPSPAQGLTVSPETLSLLSGATTTGTIAAAAAAQAGPGLTSAAPGSAAAPAASGILGGATLPEEPSGPGSPASPSLRSLDALVDLATQSGRAGTRIPDQQVGSDNAISIPYAGRIPVAGRTPVEVQRMIEERLGGRALDPQVLVVVKQSAANSVSVSGEAVGGARVALSAGGDRLLQVIAAAGGATAPVHETFVRLSRNGVTATVPLATLVADPNQDIFAEPGDVVTLVRWPQTFSVFGATGKNATLTFVSDRLSLSEALGRAGGLLDDRADPRAVFLFRYEPADLVQALGQPLATAAPGGMSPIVYRLDLMEAKSYLLARRFPVHDKDIIFVANSEIRPVYRFFTALSQITGPVETGLLTCHYSAQC